MVPEPHPAFYVPDAIKAQVVDGKPVFGTLFKTKKRRKKADKVLDPFDV
jgi:hypothetical protein